MKAQVFRSILLLSVMRLALAGTDFAAAQSGSTISSSDGVHAAMAASAAEYFKAAPSGVGLSIGVFKDGRFYTYNAGSIRRNEHDPPSPGTLYPIASITKTFTGTLLAQAVVEGRVQFTDDVRKYLPGAYPNLEYEGHPIELQFLVNHVSGLPFNLPDIPGNRPPFKPPLSPAALAQVNHYSRADFLQDLHAVKLTSIPGQRFSYSNAGAVLLSLVLERVYGEPFEEIVKQKITAPLGMKDTTLSIDRSQSRRFAPGYDQDGITRSDQAMLSLGADGLRSTVDDLLKYAAWEIKEDNPAVKLTHEPRLNLAPGYAVGLNWQMIHKGDDVRIWQDGSAPGYLSFCLLFPKLDMAVVVLSNEDDSETSKAFEKVAPSIAKSIDPRSSVLF